MVSATAAFLQRISARSTGVCRIEFAHERPANAARYDCFECKVSFGAPHNTIAVSVTDLDQATRWPNEYLAHAFALEGERTLANLSVSRLDPARFLEVVASLFDSGAVTIRQVARRLEMSVATLRRRLRSYGTTFDELVFAERRKRHHSYAQKFSRDLARLRRN